MVPTETPQPSRPLAPAARWLWRVEGAGMTVAAIVAASVLGGFVDGGWERLAWSAVVATAVTAIGVVPELRWHRWRWDVRAQEIDIRHGTFAVTRTLVPMLRVQHVDTRRNLLQQLLGLATVVFHTAAGANAIPALAEREANEVRDRIAQLARTADEL